MQEHDPVGKPHREVEIVQHGNDSGAVLRAPPRRLDEVDLMAHVEAGRRLIQQQQAWPMQRLAAGKLHQDAGQMRALLFAAGERRQLPVAEMRQSDLGERGIDQPLRAGAAGIARAHMNDLLDRERESDADMLRQHRAVVSEVAWRIGMDLALLQFDPALCRAKVAGQHAQERRLAGAVGADDRDHFAGRNAQVDGIDLRIKAGEMVAIVGPNGAGKSTLLRMLSGDLRPTRGQIRLKQREIHAYPPRQLAHHRAMLSQHVNVTFPFTVEEIVHMGAGDTGRAAAQRLVDAALGEVDLAHFSHRQLPTLSGGEQQRAHFARVLVQLACGEAQHGPGLLLLDEPTSSLDMRHQIDLVETARGRAQNGTTVIAVLHDLNLAMRFADRIVLLHRGRLAVDGGRMDAITAETIRRIFEVDVTIDYTDSGVPFLLPQTMRPAGPPTA